MSDPLFARFGREFSAGDILCREGDPGDVMYVIQSGSVRITKMIAGEERVIAMLGPGEFLGELAILNGKPRSATATVVETTRCLLVEARTLEKMVAVNAEIAMRLIKKLAKRLDSADALIEVLMHRDPKARIMLALARSAEAFGEKTAEGILIRTRAEDLARDVGVDAVAASDVMQRLRRLRLASEVPGGIVVADVGRLQDFVEFLEMPQKFGGEG
ncbi:Crp/Fnr family transcriptional regulator [Polyangium mundeleinium]|uniref:Crp/Fnr family transcriptional regulator n=1 Tax=Polyangium mundeleinium TaxID=2995306 RepID=A0ABT5EK23_9BACT|nr:Crp/Fnr family transcriptional regulator [Polyangium mundeleinium]MDC0742193.1 Crp/Fnr family transcriptional regulator [Polyangium mundeleinium]